MEGVIVNLGGGNSWTLTYESDNTYSLNYIGGSFYQFWIADLVAGKITFGVPVVAPKLVGVADGSNAAAGMVGEVMQAQNFGTAMTTAVVYNICTISLTPGDWDVSGEVWFDWSTSGQGSVTGIHAAINIASATFPTSSGYNNSRAQMLFSGTGLGLGYLPLRTCRISVSVTTSVYLVARVYYGSGTADTGSGVLWARRAR